MGCVGVEVGGEDLADQGGEGCGHRGGQGFEAVEHCRGDAKVKRGGEGFA